MSDVEIDETLGHFLKFAVRNNRHRIIKLLLKSGAEVDYDDDDMSEAGDNSCMKLILYFRKKKVPMLLLL